MPAGAASWAVLVFTLGTAFCAGLQRHLDPSQGTQHLIELDLGEVFASAAVLSLLLAAPSVRPGLSRVDLGVQPEAPSKAIKPLQEATDSGVVNRT